MGKWLKINCDPQKEPFEWVELPDPGSSTFLPAVYRAISCDSIELVQTVVRGVCIFVDERGKLVPDWWCNINQVASRLYAGTAHGDPIVGEVLVGELQRVGEYQELDLFPCSLEKYQRLMDLLMA